MEKLLEGVGAALMNMPPGLAAIVIVILGGGALSYAWRRAGEEAKRERAEAEKAKSETVNTHLAAINTTIGKIKDGQDEMHSDIKVLLDRKR